jgi:hypothetical protein
MVYRNLPRRRKARHQSLPPGAFRPHLELLEKRALLSVTGGLAAGGDTTASTEDPAAIEHAALMNFQGADLAGNDGPTAKLGWDLTLLSEEYKNYQSHNPGGAFKPSNSLLDVHGQYVTVDVVSSGSLTSLKTQLTALGMQSPVIAGSFVEGNLPISALGQLAGVAGVRFVNPGYKPITNAGLVHDQGDNAMRSDLARFNFGLTGAGSTVGVMSDSFNLLPYVTPGDGMSIDIANGDLPVNTANLDDASSGTDEGRALAQIVHDVAPGASIQFATADGGQAHFADNIRLLAHSGSNIIVDDVRYFAEPMFQDGLVAQAVNDVVSQGVSYFSAAGNSADNSYASAFVDSGVVGRNGGKLLDFDAGPGVATMQELNIPIGGSFFPVLQWDQPFASLGGPGSASDMNIELFSSTGQILRGIVSPSNIGGDPIEIWNFTNITASTQFFVRIELLEGPAPGRLQYVDFGAGSTIRTFGTQSGTNYGHSNTAGALGVAASAYFFTPHFGQDPPDLNTFSSKGGVPLLFDASGHRLAVPFDTQSPQITGPDGANTTFFGALGSRDHELDTLPNFYGTSASAPHVAAVAALMLQAAGGVGSLTPEQIYTFMQDSAVDILQRRDVDDFNVTIAIPDGEGFDLYSGHGLLDAFLAVQQVAGQLSIGSDVVHNEGDGGTTDFVFSASFLGLTNKIVTVAYTTVNDSATSPQDFALQTGTLTFGGASPSTQTITVKIVGDTTAESDETFFVKLSNPTNAALGRNQAVGKVINDDVGVSISDVTVTESDAGTTNAVFTISAAGLVNHSISVSYTTLDVTAFAASDYQPRAGAVTFAPGGGTINVTVPIIGDKLNELTENFQVLLVSPNGARIAKGVGIGTILDNEPTPSLYVNDVQVATTQVDPPSAVFTVALNAASGQEVKVNYFTANGTAQAGIDYIAQNGVITFAPGVKSQFVTVPIIASGATGSNETFFLNLSGPSNAGMVDPQGVGTIVFGSAPADRIIDNDDAGFGATQGWVNVTNTLAYQLDYAHHAAGTANDRATWTFDGLLPGQYQVLTRWIPFSNRATNAPYTILDGPNSLGTALVNQQLEPAGDVSNGVTWQSLGTFQISTGSLAVRLGGNANGFVIADAVRIVPQGAALAATFSNHNAAMPLDVNGDTRITSSDALLVINELLSPQPAVSPQAGLATPLAAVDGAGRTYFLDVSGDGRVTARDALMVIGYLLNPSAQTASASPAPDSPSATAMAAVATPAAVDLAIGQLDEPELEPAVSPLTANASTPATDGAQQPDSKTTQLLTPQSVRAYFASSAKKSPAKDPQPATL